MQHDAVGGLPRASGGPVASALLRERPEDFVVHELLGVEASGEGEHVLLQIEKRALTTAAVQQALARLAAVPLRSVGYSGLKDKWACTRQWFSVHLPLAAEPDWQQLETAIKDRNESAASLRVLAVARHHRKLRVGTHRANRFELALRLTGEYRAECAGPLAERIGTVSAAGFPNYFTEQRFGYRGRNLEQARSLFAGRRLSKVQRSMALSAALALLFNEVLAARVAADSWSRPLAGDVFMLAGSQSVFVAGEDDESTLLQRLRAGDIHVSGPLAGEGGMQATQRAGEIEQAALGGHAELVDGLCKLGMKSGRRALRALASGLQWSIDGDILQLQFELDRGAYATALLRELVEYEDRASAA